MQGCEPFLKPTFIGRFQFSNSRMLELFLEVRRKLREPQQQAEKLLILICGRSTKYDSNEVIYRPEGSSYNY